MKRSLVLFTSILLMLSACFGGSGGRVPVQIYGTSAGEGSGGVHIVRAGETLYSIANRYKLVMKDLAVANNIGAPYAIDPGQRLRLPPPPTYRVRKHDSISTVARIFGVSTQKLAALNNIGAPYRIVPGQVLKLPRVTAAEASAGYQAVKLASVPQPGVKASQQDFVVEERLESEPSKQGGKTAQAAAARPEAVKAQPPKRSSSKFLRPVEGGIISSYGSKDGGLHNDGVNIRAPLGTPVKAADNGVVVYAGNELKGTGNLVLVRHSDRWMTAYAHLDKITVSRGDVLSRGQILGNVGSTGSVDSPQLHFEVRRGTTAINPDKYL